MKCQDEKEDLEQRCKRLMQSIASAAEVGYSGFNAVFDFKRRFVDVLIISSTNSKGDYLQSFEYCFSVIGHRSTKSRCNEWSTGLPKRVHRPTK